MNTQGGKYPVLIGEGLDFGKLALDVKKPCRVVVVSDDNVFSLYGDAVMKSFVESGYKVSGYILTNGEASKNFDVVTRLLRFLVRCDVTRQDILVALGGGVVGDVTGFAAAIYLRGIDFIQLPTTVLAAVDSSVGGKTGVDLPEGKNLAGAFHQPLAVFCDTGTFATLPREVYADGMAEVVKHGMIADKDLLLNLGKLSITEICRRNVEIKASIVEQDEFDKGQRMLLNFGHTIGHAVETLSDYRISHGSAVAIGMTAIARASEKSGLTESPCLEELKKTLEHLGLPTSCRYSAKELADAALHDKKRSGETITLVIPKRIGHAELYRLPVSELDNFIEKGIVA
ncbi:MAG: 3-dehydroquinate synthase [Treponema sp.]|nr:3-dehydroquinate synthase [Treponema sp.]